MGSEVIAPADAFDLAHTIKFDMQIIPGKLIPLKMLTDDLSLFDFSTKAIMTTGKQLMINIKTINDSYPKKELSNVMFYHSESI